MRVSMVCFRPAGGNACLSGIEVPRITADLGGSDDCDLTTAQPLRENAVACVSRAGEGRCV